MTDDEFFRLIRMYAIPLPLFPPAERPVEQGITYLLPREVKIEKPDVD